MLDNKINPPTAKTSAGTGHPFDFECYGVKIRIEGNIQSLVDEAEKVARFSLLDDIRTVTSGGFDFTFTFEFMDDGFIRVKEGDNVVALEKNPKFLFDYFNSLIRIAVAEGAKERVFMHAGAVGWRGKAIVFPGTSFAGKSTLVAELVRNGAIYYSDDYAIFDVDGNLHPFPRTLSMRADDEAHSRYEVTPEDLGGSTGTAALSVGSIVFTKYEKRAVWEPKVFSKGSGVLEMIPYTFSFRNRPEFSLPVLNNVARGAIIISSQRGSAEIFAKTILNFVDKHVD